METLVIPRRRFVEVLARLRDGAEVRLALGRAQVGAERRWTVQDARADVGGTERVSGRGVAGGVRFRLARRVSPAGAPVRPAPPPSETDRLIPFAGYPERIRPSPFAPPDFTLWLGEGPERGSIWAEPLPDGTVVRRLQVPGPEMLELPVLGARAGADPVEARDPEGEGGPRDGRWSREIGWLGRGAWARWRRLRIAVVGCGGTGSHLAAALARAGAAVALVDGDRMEPHNLTRMALVGAEDLGAPKAEALARRLVEAQPWLAQRVTACAAPFPEPETLAAVRAAELVAVCADHDAARVAAAVLAVRHHRVLLDVGTAVVAGDPENTCGADVRLVLPGEGCLLCTGGVVEYAAALETLASGAVRRREWRAQRAGSADPLNRRAAAEACWLLVALVRGRLRQTTWLRLEEDPTTGLLESRRMRAPDPGRTCELCLQAGAGDIFA